MCIPRATVSAVSCLVVPAFIFIDLLISRVLKINDADADDDDDDDDVLSRVKTGPKSANSKFKSENYVTRVLLFTVLL